MFKVFIKGGVEKRNLKEFRHAEIKTIYLTFLILQIDYL